MTERQVVFVVLIEDMPYGHVDVEVYSNRQLALGATGNWIESRLDRVHSHDVKNSIQTLINNKEFEAALKAWMSCQNDSSEDFIISIIERFVDQSI